MPKNVYIVDAARLPIGKFLGQYKNLEASILGAITIEYLLQKTGIRSEWVDELIVGQVLIAGVGMNPARQAGLAAGLKEKTPCYLVNQVCGSSLRAVIDGAKSILLQDAQLVLVGGQENMSRARHTILARMPQKLGDSKLTDSLYCDGLVDYFYQYAMGNTAENVAKKYKITKKMQDNFAYLSQKKAQEAEEKGCFVDQSVPVVFLQEKTGQQDNFCEQHLRKNITLQEIERLQAVFQKEGTVTAGNSSGINDGAAFLVLASEAALEKYGISPLAKITGYAHFGLDPQYMGLGPLFAIEKLLSKTGVNLADFDLIEINEAFAATSLAVQSELKIDEQKININGGAIALGHPIGASGARILIDLLYQMHRRKNKKGIATMCIGGGMGIALAVENCNS